MPRRTPLIIVAVGRNHVCCVSQTVSGHVLAAGGPAAGSGVAGIEVTILWNMYRYTATTASDGAFSATSHDDGYRPIPGAYVSGMSAPTWAAYTEGDEQHLPAALAGPFVPVLGSSDSDPRWRAS